MQLFPKLRRKGRGENLRNSNYSYACARVRAMKSKLLPKDTYSKILNMGIDQITKTIEESEYKQDIDILAREYSGVDLIEHALNRNLAVTFTKILDISEGEPNYLLGKYLKKYDIWGIKTILRGKYYNASPEEIKENLISAGKFSYEFLSELARKDSYTDVISALENTDYYPILKQYDGTNLTDIENKLEKEYYKDLFISVHELKSKSSKIFADFVGTEIDIKNLRTLFRLKMSGVNPDEIRELMIEGGHRLKMKDIEGLLPLSFEDFLSAIDKYSYWYNFSDVVSSDMESLIDLETQLLKQNVKFASSISHVYPLSIVPIMDYILNKKVEVDNLRIIIRGKAAGLEKEVIRKQLVI
ncbi:MAG: V-type ATP synthase subunit C [Methanohalobium sp.]|uniref:V-type ATP synthase subunit C n=1 Tax=Methanohalobium sp. TaxID=2837493 RepID=UPI00397A758C